MSNRTKRFFIDLPPYLWGIVVFVSLLSAAIALHKLGIVTIKTDIDILAITGIPLFFVTVVGLAKRYRVQAAGLVRSHISEFLSNRDLYSAFHELIYSYDDKTWGEVEKLMPSDLDREEVNKTHEMREKSWEALQTINNNKETGVRIYDPDFFQGSLEEQRLDAVLHYFDMLAYNQQRKLITVEDITGVSGYHLAVIGSRKVIKYYLDRNKEWWKNLPYEERVGAEEPFENLRNLLKEIKLKNMGTTGRKLVEESK